MDDVSGLPNLTKNDKAIKKKIRKKKKDPEIPIANAVFRAVPNFKHSVIQLFYVAFLMSF